MKALIAFVVLIIVVASGTHYTQAAPHLDNHAARQSPIRPESRYRIETMTQDAVLLSGVATDMELVKMPLPRRENESYYFECGADSFSPNTQFYGLSGSGLGTCEGTALPPIHFASIIDTVSGRTMKLYVHLAASKGFINRSALGWGGDYLPGIRAAARMYGRRGSEGISDQMTAELHLTLPHQSKIQFVFAGYDSEGNQIAAFGEQPFAQYIATLKPNKNKSVY